MRVTPSFGIVGDAPVIRRLREEIAVLGPSNMPVLIEGPTGSGKELVAQGIHLASGRKGPFVSFNVCALPDGTLEAALFGHVRGGFTGAVSDSPGYLREADGGTALFDEIGALPLSLQPKLLRAIETRRFRPVGASRDQPSDFRLVAATNDSLAKLVAGGSFWADLFYRLRGAVLVVPSLAERLDDVPNLAAHFLHELGTPNGLSDGAVSRLQEHGWPGNVRELRYVIQHAALVARGDVITSRDVGVALNGDGGLPAPGSAAEFESRRLMTVLHETGWDTAAAALLMGVHRATVYRRMERLGLAARRRGPNRFASIRANSQPGPANPANASGATHAQPTVQQGSTP